MKKLRLFVLFCFIATTITFLYSLGQITPPAGLPINLATVAPQVNGIIELPDTVKIAPVDLIIDSDWGGDIDDMGDLALANALADAGYCHILAMTSPVTADFSPKVADIVTRYFDRIIPIGKAASGIAGADGYGSYLTNNYTSALGTSVFADTAVSVTRKVLAGRPNATVVMVYTGPLDNLANVWNSTSDVYSTLSGAQLMAQKVKRIVVAAGYWPNSAGFGNPGNNLTFSPTAAQILNSITTVPVTFSGDEIGNLIITGETIRNLPGVKNPVRDAWDHYFSSAAQTGRPAWGQNAILKAVLGNSDPRDGTAMYTATAGTATVDAGGHNTWVNGAGNYEYLSYAGVQATTLNYLTNKVNTYLTTAPKGGGITPIGRFGDTNTPGPLRLETTFTSANSKTNILSVNTNALNFDAVNYRFQVGAPQAAGLPWNPGARSAIFGIDAPTTVTYETMWQAIHPNNSGLSFPQSARFRLGRNTTPTSFSPNSEFRLELKTDSSVLLDDTAVWSAVRFVSNGSIIPDGSFLAQDTLGYSFVGDQTTGFSRPSSGTIDFMSGNTKTIRFYANGFAEALGSGMYIASGALGVGAIDVGWERSAAGRMKVVSSQGGSLGDVEANSLQTAQGWTFLGEKKVIRTTDQTTVTSTFADDTVLTVAILANKNYLIEGSILTTSAGATAGVKVGINGPASPTAVNYNVSVVPTGLANVVGNIATGYDQGITGANVAAATRSFIISGSVINGANAGNLVIRNAQQVTDAANATTFKAGSWFSVKQLN